MGLSTHILDTALGRPAAGVTITLTHQLNAEWQAVGQGVTDADGRCRTLLGEQPLRTGVYRLGFATGQYFQAQNLATLYPVVEITFQVRDPEQHHHIPLLLAANGFTTYRGS